eukprot:GHVO01013872.1.p1 GENE.GHVO01013872.1~~GHVO01013872.1.p1  ORF type:complete len:509 (-),score=58.80 GHVO01013872.1:166-1692(-)
MAWWIILIILGYMAVVFLADLKMLYYFEHVEDKKDLGVLIGQVVVLVGFQISWLVLIGLPTDAYDVKQDGGLDMEVFWMLLYVLIVLCVALPVPFSIFYYEADTDPRVTKTAPWKKALCYGGITFSLIVICVGVTYAFLSEAKIDAVDLGCDEFEPIHDHPYLPAKCWTVNSDGYAVFRVDFITYMISCSSFVGSWVLIAYLGLGFVALPMDLILGFIDRPRPIDIETYSNQKQLLADKAAGLKVVGAALKEEEMALRHSGGLKKLTRSARLKTSLNRFRQSVYILENEFNDLNISMKERGENPVLSWTKLGLGLVSGVLSILWILHIILCMLVKTFVPSMTGFMDSFLELISKPGTYVLDLFIYAALVLYLFACVIKGSFKFGMRLFLCYPIHPMKKEETYLNSFLFNTMTVMLAAAAIPSFSQMAFEEYSYGTYADYVFRILIGHLPLMKTFYQIRLFPILLIVWTFLCLVYLSIRPRDQISVSVNEPAEVTENIHRASIPNNDVE